MEKVDVREKILAAAVGLLRVSGVKKLAQPQVARAAGVPQGHLTYYFPKKADLLAAVAGRFMELLADDLLPLLASSSRERLSPAAVRARALKFAGALAKDRERTRMLLGLVVEADQDPDLKAQIATGARGVRSLVGRMLGRPEEDPDVDLALATLWGLALQHVIFADRRTDADTDRLLARLGELMSALPPGQVGSTHAPTPNKGSRKDRTQ